MAISQFYVLLASPSAAQSGWVKREIEYWLANKSPDHLLIVVTDGEIIWDDGAGDFDWSLTTALPVALRGVFRSEPNWFDLRWARNEEGLSLTNDRFRDAIATLAAALREVPKDELIGENLRQHRRSGQLTVTALVLMTIVTVAALSVAIGLAVSSRRGPSGDLLAGLLGALVSIALIALAARFIWGGRARLRSGKPSGAVGGTTEIPPLAPELGDVDRLPTGAPRLLDEFVAALKALARRTPQVDVYIGPTASQDRAHIEQLARTIRTLGKRRLRRGRLRVIMETRTAQDTHNLSRSFDSAERARYYIHVCTAETRDSSAANFILEDWLTENPDDNVLLVLARSDTSNELEPDIEISDLIPPVLTNQKHSGVQRPFDLRSVFQGNGLQAGRSLQSEVGRLIASILRVDPHWIVANRNTTILREARRRARIDEPLLPWQLPKTLAFDSSADAVVRLPEVHSAVTALGKDPLEYVAEINGSEKQLVTEAVSPKARELAAQADRNAYRETSIRLSAASNGVGQASGFLALAGIVVLVLGPFVALIVSPFLTRTAVLAIGLSFVSTSVATLAAAILLKRWMNGSEVRRQRALNAAYERSIVSVVKSLRTYLRDEVILPHVRLQLNEKLAKAGKSMLDVYDNAALTTQVLDRFRLETGASRKVIARIGTPGGTAIGIAGPRGAGKTTLLTWLCRTIDFEHPEDPGSQIGTVVPAPVIYKSEEFIAQILAAVCREIIRRQARGGASAGPYRHALAKTWRGRAFAALLCVVSLATLAVIISHPVMDRRQFLIIGLSMVALVTGLLAMGVGSLISRIWLHFLYSPQASGRTRVAKSAGRRIRDVTRTALVVMNWLYYSEQQTQDAGITLKSPMGLETTGSRTLVFEGKPWTTPEIVHQFREFVSLLTSSGYRVVIGIDELDKIENDEQAIQLLNDTKALFGLLDCYFLVSISMSALARFEQRGLPFQDAFESALDEVIRVEALKATETVQLLQRRLLGMPTNSALVCHLIGGGLPRDVMRALRDLVGIEYPASRMQPERYLVINDLHRRIEGARLRYELDGKEPPTIVRRLCALAGEDEYDATEWLRVAGMGFERASGPEGNGRSGTNGTNETAETVLAEEVRRLALYVAWAVTAELYVAKLTAEQGTVFDSATTLAEELARCRRLLARDLIEAATVLNRTRSALGLKPLP